MSKRSRDFSRRELFRLFGGRRREREKARSLARVEGNDVSPAKSQKGRAERVVSPVQPEFGPLDPKEMERERRAARALLGDVPPPSDVDRSESPLFWISAARGRRR